VQPHAQGLLLPTIAILSAVAVVSMASPSHAADPKPDAIIKYRIIEARVLLDDQIKADPALAADCFAEGKRRLEKNAADAAASRKQDPQIFRNGGWDLERKYTIPLAARNSVYPDVPTLKEAMGIDYSIGGWRGIGGPKGLPAENRGQAHDDNEEDFRLRAVQGLHGQGQFADFMDKGDVQMDAAMKAAAKA
jgi:hypothetical protein